MRRAKRYILATTLAATAATAQIRLPAVQLPTLPVQTLPQTLNQLQSQSLGALSDVRHLANTRLIRANRQVVDTDQNGDPIVRSEILALSPADAAVDAARARGFTVDRESAIGPMNIRLVVFTAPQKLSTKKALRILREADPAGSYDYNHIYGGGGAVGGGTVGSSAVVGGAARSGATRGGAISPGGQGTAASAGDPAPAANQAAQRPARIGLLDTGIDTT
ncbi:MAG: hypothetical protein ACRD3S_04505, partial [Terracidiphilus sp.]